MFIKKSILTRVREQNKRLADMIAKQSVSVEALTEENNRLHERVAELESLCKKNDICPHTEFTVKDEVGEALCYVKAAIEGSSE